MADSGLPPPPPPPHPPPPGPGPLTAPLPDARGACFNRSAHGRPVGFVASPKWKPRTDVYETDDELIVHMDIAGMQADDFSVELDEGILRISGERTTRQPGSGKRHYHAMEVQIGPFERRFRLPVVVDPASIKATYEHGFLEVRLAKQPPRSSGAQSVRVT